MIETVVAGAATTLGKLLLEEGNYLSDVREKVQELKTELTRMQCFLKDADVDARQNESETAKQGVADMKELAYEAEDIIEKYANTVATGEGRGVQKALKRCTNILHEGMTMHEVGPKIDSIKTRICSLKQHLRDNGITESIKGGRPSPFHESQRMDRQTFPRLEHEVVGFDDDLNKLVEFLLREEEGNRVASICGMGGLGKTTLAQMVFNHPKIQQHFVRRAWVYISQQCQKRPIWEEILIKVLSPTIEERNEIQKLTDDEIVDKLCNFQKEQRCLVILDDIWNVETWKNLSHLFPSKDTVSKILLTSRNKEVPQSVDPRGFLHELQCLNKRRSLELLEKIAISRKEDPATKTYMDMFGKKMIKYCGGLPLAITVLGKVLATKQTQKEWEDVLKHIESHLYEEKDLLEVKKVLALSYNDLPSNLKACFLYLGHFPRNFEIPTKEVIRMWMGEGFISQIQHGGTRRDTTEEDLGERYIRELEQRFMIQMGKRGSLGRIKTCRIHDLMRHFCQSKVQDENFLRITDVFSMKEREASNGNIRRLSIISESGNDSLEVINFNDYPKARSVLHLLHPLDLFYFKGSRFKKLKSARVLHLENFKSTNGKLPKDIGCLLHLKYLSLKNSHINKVPSSIGNLWGLDILDLRSNCMRVPNVFKNMVKLRHLYLPYDYWVWPVWAKLELANLCHLQTLVNVQHINIQISSELKFNRLQVLHVRTNNQGLQVRSTKRAQDALQKLVSCSPDMKKLSLCVFIKKLPHQFPQNLAKLTLCETYLEDDPMPTFERLPNLKILRLLSQSFKGKKMVCSKRGFLQLKSLVLCHLKRLEEWTVEEGALLSLCTLEIGDCKKLETIPDGLSFIRTLQELKLISMPPSFKESHDVGGPDFDKVQHVPSIVFQNCEQ